MPLPYSDELILLTNSYGYLSFSDEDDWNRLLKLMSAPALFAAMCHAHPIEGLRCFAEQYDSLVDKFNRGEDIEDLAFFLVDCSEREIVDIHEPLEEELPLYLMELFNTIAYYAFSHDKTLAETVQVFQERRYWELLACRGRFFASQNPIDINRTLNEFGKH